MCSEETQSLSDVTYLMESLACATDGIKRDQPVFSVNYRNTLSVLLLSTDAGKYSCDGSDTEGSRWSDRSDAVTLTVSGEFNYHFIHKHMFINEGFLYFSSQSSLSVS